MNKPKNVVVPQLPTEGARRLWLVGFNLSQIASTLGVDKSAVSLWRNGKRIPGPESRLKICEVYGVPIEAWSQAPAKGSAVDAAADLGMELDEVIEAVSPVATNAPVARARATGRRGEGPTLIEQATRQLELAIRDAATPGLLPTERVKARREAVAIMQTIDRMKRAAATFEGDVVKAAPFFRRATKALLEALRPFPDAARAVAQRFVEIDAMDDGAQQGALDEDDEDA